MSTVKLSLTQIDVIEHMEAAQEPIIRVQGGFWTFPDMARAAGYEIVQDQYKSPYWRAGGLVKRIEWWTSSQTLEALAKKGAVKKIADDGPRWRQPYELVSR